MMGRSHVLLGAAGWLAAAPTVAAALGHPFTPAELAASTLVCAGATMRPDLDHEDATIATALGPVTRLTARWVGRLAGGHRMGTHSLVFCLAAGFSSSALSLTAGLVSGLLALVLDDPGRQAAAAAAEQVAANARRIDVLVCYALALRAIGIAKPGSGARLGWPAVAAVAAALTWATGVFVPGTWPWLGPAIAAGCLLHNLADMLTPGGIPPWWPWSRRRVALPIIDEVGNWQEELVVAPVLAALTLGLAWLQFPGLHGVLELLP